MAGKTITMHQIRRIIQLSLKGVSKRSIARQCGISKNTVKDYLRLISRCGLPLEKLMAMDDENLHIVLYDPPPAGTVSLHAGRYEDLFKRFPKLKTELGKTGVTRELLWQEYRVSYPGGYSYSQFCHHFSQYLESKKYTMHFEHFPAERMEVDFAGDTISYVNESGEIIACQFFVAILPFSGYDYVEAVHSQKQRDAINCLENALCYFGGVPRSIISDNLRSFIKRADRYEPELTDALDQLSLHYDTTVSATRPGKPKDKASVEKAVDLTYQRIYAPLRNRTFFSLADLNKAIREQLELHHQRRFRNGHQSRKELFEEQEKDRLAPLPSSRLDIKQTVTAKVQRNYHVVLGQDWHYYSAPYQYTGKQVTIVYTSTMVEIYHNHTRIAAHRRILKRNGYSTTKEHMPPNHFHYVQTKGYDADYFLAKARKISPETEQVVSTILQSRFFYEQTYNACLGILRLGDKYGPDRLTKACGIALTAKACSYRFILNVLKNNTDQKEQNQPDLFTPIIHDNLRGKSNYQ
jgi:transposase